MLPLPFGEAAKKEMRMARCKQGDLAIVIREFDGCEEIPSALDLHRGDQLAVAAQVDHRLAGGGEHPVRPRIRRRRIACRILGKPRCYV